MHICGRLVKVVPPYAGVNKTAIILNDDGRHGEFPQMVAGLPAKSFLGQFDYVKHLKRHTSRILYTVCLTSETCLHIHHSAVAILVAVFCVE